MAFSPPRIPTGIFYTLLINEPYHKGYSNDNQGNQKGRSEIYPIESNQEEKLIKKWLSENRL